MASLPIAWHLGALGYRSLLVSQPGYGASTGPPDYCGPRTVAAVVVAVVRMVADGLGTAGEIVIWGFSRGSIVAGQAIRIRPDLFSAAVLQAGGYDLERDFRESRDEGFRANIVLEPGGDPSALRERSLIFHVDEVRCPVLILQGDEDGTFLPRNARRLAEEMERAGREHRFLLLPGGHELPWSLAAGAAAPFLRRHRRRPA